MTDTAAGRVASTHDASDHTEGMSYLETLPSRLVTLYIPLFIHPGDPAVPFYWMALTSIKPDNQLIDMETTIRSGGASDPETHPEAAAGKPSTRAGSGTRCTSRPAPPSCRSRPACLRPSIVRLQFKGAPLGCRDLLCLSVPPSILFIPMATVIQAYGLFDSPMALILVYPTLLIPFSTGCSGYFKDHPVRTGRGCVDRRATAGRF